MGLPTIDRFGTAPCGAPVELVRLENGGSRASVISWGASLQDLRVSGWDGPVVLGSPDLAAYLGPLKCCGAIVGPVANRIAKGRAPLGDTVLHLDRNENGKTCLHGGAHGASQKNWAIADYDATAVTLTVVLPDGEDGFPGNLQITATYELEDDGALKLTLSATTDAPTLCNLAHHGYWSFAAQDGLRNHQLQVFADTYLPVDRDLIPLGRPATVAGTGFDFRTPRPVNGAQSHGLDHNFCLGAAYQSACVLDYGPLRLEVETDAAGLQLYDGAHLSTGDFATLTGTPYAAHSGLAVEPQAWPDAPNHPDYPDIRLNPGQTFRQVSRFHAFVRH